MISSLKPVVDSFIAREKLPPGYAGCVEHWFLPMVEVILRKIASHQGTFVIGVSGSQGSGKTTLAELLVVLLEALAGLRCINLSIDDFYLTHEERQRLAGTVHPLLATRGVPGTHDVALAAETVDRLKGTGEVAIPRFDKAVDDRVPEDRWPRVMAPVDVIILEGWCLSIGPEPDDALRDPVNALESDEDPDGSWRRYVNDAIRDRYVGFYDQVDYLIMLKAPSFEKVYEWRQNQEDKLKEKFRRETDDQENHRIMSQDQLKRFIQHYERVTRHGLGTLPAKADIVFQLTNEQTIAGKL